MGVGDAVAPVVKRYLARVDASGGLLDCVLIESTGIVVDSVSATGALRQVVGLCFREEEHLLAEVASKFTDSGFA